MWHYLLREVPSVVSGAVSDSSATELELGVLLTDLSSTALHNKEWDHHLQNRAQAITSLINSESRTALSSEILQTQTRSCQGQKRKPQILSKGKVPAASVEAWSSAWVHRGLQNLFCLALKCFIPLKYKFYPQIFSSGRHTDLCMKKT